MSSKKQNAVQSIRMYSTTWCGDCRRSKRFLQEHQIDFEEINIENDPEAAAVVISLNRGMRSVPTIVFPDGSVLVEPSNTALANKLGIKS
jgi:glutaredoxin-like protein